MNTLSVKVLDNQLELVFYKVSMRTQVLELKIDRALVDHAPDDILDQIIFENFKVFMARTADIVCLTNTPDEFIIEWLTFWDHVKGCHDYVALYELFMTQLNLSHNQIWGEAFEQANQNPYKVERVLGRPENLTEAEQADPLLESVESPDAQVLENG